MHNKHLFQHFTLSWVLLHDTHEKSEKFSRARMEYLHDQWIIISLLLGCSQMKEGFCRAMIDGEIDK